MRVWCICVCINARLSYPIILLFLKSQFIQIAKYKIVPMEIGDSEICRLFNITKTFFMEKHIAVEL